MRIIRYAVINTKTNERIYINCNQAKCEEFLNNMENNEDYVVAYHWMSV